MSIQQAGCGHSRLKEKYQMCFDQPGVSKQAGQSRRSSRIAAEFTARQITS
jgi:hypothetical protein